MSNTVNLIDPDGNPVSVDASEAPKAIAKGGYTVPSQQEVQDYQDQQNYGSPLQSAGAFGAAAARTATFGGSDELLTNTGLVDPQTLAGLKRANPKSDIAGDVAGIAIPALVGDEAGPLNLVNGVSKIGSAAEKATAAALPEATGLAGRILSNAGSKAVGSAIEGAAYGAGQVVSEHALGDPDLTAQHAIGQIGLSALLGGGLGGALGIAEETIPPVVQAAKDAIQTATEKTKQVLSDGFAKASSKVSGVSEDAINTALDNRNFVPQTPQQKEQLAKEFSDSIANQYNKTEQALKTANKEIRPVETEGLLKDVPADATINEYQRIFNKIDDTIQEIRNKPDVYPARFATKLEDLKSGLLRDGKTAQTPAEIFSTLNDAKQTIDSKILKFDGVASAADSDALSLVKNLRSEIRDSLENENIFGEGASRQSAFNEAQNDYLTAKKEFQKAFLYKTKSNSGSTIFKANPTKANSFLKGLGDAKNQIKKEALDRYQEASQKLIDEIDKSYQAVPYKSFDSEGASSFIEKNKKFVESAQKQKNLERVIASTNTGVSGTNPLVAGGLGHALGLPGTVIGAGVGALNALRNPGATISRLAALESLVQKSTSKIESGVQAVISGSSRAFSVGRGEVAAGIAKEFGKDHDDSLQTYKKRKDAIEMVAENSDALLDKLHNGTQELYEHAPNVTESMQKTAVAGINFLNSKLEKHPKQGALDSDWVASKAEISRFNRYYSAVENPTSILKQAAAGTLTQEGVEAVKTVYPELYDKINSELLNQLSSKKASAIPFRQKQMLSLLTGKPMTGSVLPQNIAANQTIFAGNTQKPQQTGSNHAKTSQAGLGKLNLASELQTKNQLVSARIK